MTHPQQIARPEKRHFKDPNPEPMSAPTLACKNLTYRLPDGVPTTSTSPLLDKLKCICTPSDPRWMGKKLLSNVSFEISASTMTALMGPSGAGKSTLLDCLSERKIEGTIYGEQVGVLFEDRNVTGLVRQ